MQVLFYLYFMRILSLLPFAIFIGVFLGCGIAYGNFYKLPAPIAVLAGIIVAFLLFYKNGINRNMDTFIGGCGDKNIVMMCLIILLSGAFSVLTTKIGGTEAVSQITGSYLSPKYLYAGVFISASFLSFASGTSVGAISTLTPIVAGFVGINNIDATLISASVLSGSMFGDNLSIISDTTIVATQSQGCSMKDKFRTNSRIAFLASLLTVIVLIFIGFNLHSHHHNIVSSSVDIDWFKILPYMFVIIMALMRLNVFVTLFLGVIFAGGIGLYEGIPFIKFTELIYEGFTKMSDVFLVFFLTGGLALMVEKQGGIEFIVNKIATLITTERRAKIGIASIVALVDLAIANNTVAIMVSASVARSISNRFNLKPAHTASILDISSCIVQGIIPYGAQVLALMKFINTNVDYLKMVSQCYYLIFLLIISVIYFRKSSVKEEIVSGN